MFPGLILVFWVTRITFAQNSDSCKLNVLVSMLPENIYTPPPLPPNKSKKIMLHWKGVKLQKPFYQGSEHAWIF